ncbi:LysE family translocator [Glaciecola sp. KUL10]|uniref:LysE family translocator n=1 Tax=Glaciecola sp. (strain KUL10) TaxID=2161813 RepID=UPI000D783454|nr:LysE family translocator [Glaciecola sp. KUL10]GBL04788.1 lysine exporter protein [Glaciecola sp. KUL10]
MELNTWLIYATTVVLFMITPGPSHLLMLSNSISCGYKRARSTAVGDLSANLLQMLAASFGLAAILIQHQYALVIIKWLGVGYLLLVGLKLILSNKQTLSESPQKSLSNLYWQGFITSAANPKAVVFFAALFPQFLDPTLALFPQFIILSVTYLFIDGCFLLFYGKFAEYIKSSYLNQFERYLNKISGGIFIGAACLLGIKDLSEVK